MCAHVCAHVCTHVCAHVCTQARPRESLLEWRGSLRRAVAFQLSGLVAAAPSQLRVQYSTEADSGWNSLSIVGVEAARLGRGMALLRAHEPSTDGLVRTELAARRAAMTASGSGETGAADLVCWAGHPTKPSASAERCPSHQAVGLTAKPPPMPLSPAQPAVGLGRSL